MAIEIATCNYNAYQPEMGAAVRTSIGHPRFFNHRPLVTWEGVYPERHWLELPVEEYTPRYLSKLDSYGIETAEADLAYIADQIETLTGRAPERLVLLCYENLAHEGKWCHRTMLAQWLAYNSYREIKELGPAAEPSLW